MARPSSQRRDWRPVTHGGNRIANLEQREQNDGLTVYSVRLRMPDGTHPRIVLDHGITPTEAVRLRNGLVADRDRGVAHENPLINPTVAELLDEYLAELEARIGIRDDKRRIAVRTVRCREFRVRLHLKPALGRLRVADVTTADIRRLIVGAQRNGLASRTVGGLLETITLALELAQKNGYVDRNVARELPRGDRPSHKRATEPRYLTQAELGLLLAAAPERYRPVWACCAYAALRIGEALGLQWECVDFKADTLTVRQQAADDASGILPYVKTAASAATLPLMPALKRELLAHRSRMAEVDLQRVRPAAPVFVGDHGQLIRASTALIALQRVADRVGLNPEGEPKLGQHDLRHTAAALALQAGSSPEQAAEFMRHSSPVVTMTTYAGLNADARGAAFRKMLDAGFGA